MRVRCACHEKLPSDYATIEARWRDRPAETAQKMRPVVRARTGLGIAWRGVPTTRTTAYTNEFCMMLTPRSLASRCSAFALVALLLTACGKATPPPPVDDTRDTRASRTDVSTEKSGMSTRKKVVLLAGAAALYYLYKQHQKSAEQTGPDSQYYLSKNGRVYYRDAEHRAHWVTPPSEGISVPASQAEDYRNFQGYEGQATGRDLTGLAADPE
jgi:hypothetical protein